MTTTSYFFFRNRSVCVCCGIEIRYTEQKNPAKFLQSRNGTKRPLDGRSSAAIQDVFLNRWKMVEYSSTLPNCLGEDHHKKGFISLTFVMAYSQPSRTWDEKDEAVWYSEIFFAKFAPDLASGAFFSNQPGARTGSGP